jgi:hypothetical protein
MSKARLIYLLVIASVFAFYLASYVRLPICHLAGFASGDSGFASGDS